MSSQKRIIKQHVGYTQVSVMAGWMLNYMTHGAIVAMLEHMLGVQNVTKGQVVNLATTFIQKEAFSIMTIFGDKSRKFYHKKSTDSLVQPIFDILDRVLVTHPDYTSHVEDAKKFWEDAAQEQGEKDEDELDEDELVPAAKKAKHLVSAERWVESGSDSF